MYEDAADRLAKVLEVDPEIYEIHLQAEDTHPDLTRGSHNRTADLAEEYRQVVAEIVAHHEQRGKHRQAQAIRDRHPHAR